MDDKRDESALVELNRAMGEQRETLSRLVTELENDVMALRNAQKRYHELGEALEELTHETDRKRREIFRIKLELEGQRRARVRLKGEDVPSLVPSFPHHREFVRAPFYMPVLFGGLRDIYSGLALNVSDGGMLVATCDPPPLHRRFAVEFYLDAGGEPIRAPVESVWLRTDGAPDRAGYSLVEMGLRFLALDPVSRTRLEAFSRAYRAVHPDKV